MFLKLENIQFSGLNRFHFMQITSTKQKLFTVEKLITYFGNKNDQRGERYKEALRKEKSFFLLHTRQL